MNARKQRRKASRRAIKHVELAWQAMEDGKAHVAKREMRRAVDERPTNPRFWYEYGLVLEQIGEPEQAEKALKHAVVLSPDYAEPCALLAAIAAAAGREQQAMRLLRRAVDLAPARADYRARLEALRVLVPETPTQPVAPAPCADDAAFGPDQPDALLERYDWSELGNALSRDGVAVLPELLDPASCRELRALHAHDELFEKTVALEGGHGSGGDYRFFKAPLPPSVRQLRQAVYGALAPIANDWNQRLGTAERFPSHHAQYLRQCARAGQSRSSVILLRYCAPAVNELHRDIWGKLYFPLQLAVVLSRRARDGVAGFRGGDFVLADQAVGRRRRSNTIAADLGDGVVFCGHDRPIAVGGVAARQTVFHGMSPLTDGERYVLGCPFHEYKS